jgi:hypothetical protein
MNAKIDKFSEMEKVLSVKNDTNDGMIALFGRFGIGNLLRHLSMEKKSGIDAVTLIVSLCLFRMNSLSIFSAYRDRFHGLLDYGKNSFYRMMLRPSMDWRRLLIGMSCRFEAILRKNGAEHHDSPRCYILDDTTLEKTGRAIEKVGRVFDHVSGRCVLGFKLLLLAVSDGVSTLPVDFSLHREKGKDESYGLTSKERKEQYRCRRKSSDPDRIRAEECDMSKMDVAVEMLLRAWKYKIRAQYLLADSWFTCERLIGAVRDIGRGAVHYIGLGKMGKTRYMVRGRLHNAAELVALNERDAHQCRRYRCLYIALRGYLGGQPVRIFLIKYGRNKHWNILLSSDTDITFVRAFELYQMRWNIEVLNKECKGYLNLGRYQGRNLNGQIADCTLCFITYTVLALGKRFSDYETMGEMFRAERELILTLTLWRRVLSCVEQLLTALSEIFDIDPNQMMQCLLNDEKRAQQLKIIINALMQDNPQNMGIAV